MSKQLTGGNNGGSGLIVGGNGLIGGNGLMIGGLMMFPIPGIGPNGWGQIGGGGQTKRMVLISSERCKQLLPPGMHPPQIDPPNPPLTETKYDWIHSAVQSGWHGPTHGIGPNNRLFTIVKKPGITAHSTSSSPTSLVVSPTPLDSQRFNRFRGKILWVENPAPVKILYRRGTYKDLCI